MPNYPQQNMATTVSQSSKTQQNRDKRVQKKSQRKMTEHIALVSHSAAISAAPLLDFTTPTPLPASTLPPRPPAKLSSNSTSKHTVPNFQRQMACTHPASTIKKAGVLHPQAQSGALAAILSTAKHDAACAPNQTNNQKSGTVAKVPLPAKAAIQHQATKQAKKVNQIPNPDVMPKPVTGVALARHPAKPVNQNPVAKELLQNTQAKGAPSSAATRIQVPSLHLF
jgi:hypothetical protein